MEVDENLFQEKEIEMKFVCSFDIEFWTRGWKKKKKLNKQKIVKILICSRHFSLMTLS